MSRLLNAMMRRRPKDEIEEEIRAAATHVRQAYEHSTGGDKNLEGYCARASVQLWIECAKRKINIRIAKGSGHAFCRFGEDGGRIVDVTATQFSDMEGAPSGGYPSVFIGDMPENPPRWYNEECSWYNLYALLTNYELLTNSSWVSMDAANFEHEMAILDSGRLFSEGLPRLSPGTPEYEKAVTAAATRVRRAFEEIRHPGDSLAGLCGRAAVQFRIEARRLGVEGVSIIHGEGHAFCRLVDGRIVDVTATQFNGCREAPPDGYSPVIIGALPVDPPHWHKGRDRWSSLVAWLCSGDSLYGARYSLFEDRAKVLETSI